MGRTIPDKSKLHPAGSIEKLHRQMERDLKKYWLKGGNGLDPRKVEEAGCSLCGSAVPEPKMALFFKFRFAYFRCPSCGLVYHSPRPKKEYISGQYISGRFLQAFREIYLPSAEYRMSTIFRERIKDIILPRVRRGRLLDIGCSSGHFLKVAGEHGFEVYGIEPNPEMVRFASKNLKLPNILEGVFRKNEYPDDYFDAVTLWDVLEHVPEPGTLLRSVFKAIKPNGWVFAYTENVESLNVFITGMDSEIFAPDVHLRHYSPDTFSKEFEKAGFLVKEVLTKGLDIQHIHSTLALNPDKYPCESKSSFKYGDELQNIINACGRGDNLRLFAQKAVR